LLFYGNKNIINSDVNASLFLQNATYSCQSLGLGSFYSGFVVFAAKRDKNLQRLLELPQNFQIYGGLAIGYPKYQYNLCIIRDKPEIKWI
jgi:hypothetical protein